MKKIMLWILTLSVILFSPLSFSVAAAGENWYFSSKGNNDRPGLPSVPEELAKGIGKDEKVLYLTFDAGYENGNVAKTVEILKENDVTGAFFILSHLIQSQPELCKTIKENGNLVCNHTSTHPEIPTLSKEALTKELETVASLYREVTGYEMDPYFRPPKGCYSISSLEKVKEAGYRSVFWSLAWEDWDNNNQKPPEYAMKKLTSRVHNGAVILLHPTSETNTKILEDFIRQMKEAGYRFGSLEELWEN